MSGPGTQEESLLFLHIPKAAGTTLSRIAERNFPAATQYRLGGVLVQRKCPKLSFQ